MTNYRIERAKDPQDLARQACETVAAQIDLALDQRDRCQIALSGGSTPANANTPVTKTPKPQPTPPYQ